MSFDFVQSVPYTGRWAWNAQVVINPRFQDLLVNWKSETQVKEDENVRDSLDIWIARRSETSTSDLESDISIFFMKFESKYYCSLGKLAVSYPCLGLRNHFLSIELDDRSSTSIYPSSHVSQTSNIPISDTFRGIYQELLFPVYRERSGNEKSLRT